MKVIANYHWRISYYKQSVCEQGEGLMCRCDELYAKLEEEVDALGIGPQGLEQ